MRLTRTFPGALLACALALAAVPAVQAAPPQSADLAAFRDYTLNDGFLDKWRAIQQESVKDPCNLGMMSLMSGDENDSESLDRMAARYDAQPGVHAMLARHGLTARSYLLGALTLLSAGIQEVAQQHPEMVSKGYIQTNPGFAVSDANMAFYRQHKADIQQLMQKLGQEGLRANGGKLPDCSR